MTNQLSKPFKEFPAGTIVKIHSIEKPFCIVSVPPASRKYMVPMSCITRKKPTLPEYVNPHGTKTSMEISPARPLVHPADWSKLDLIPITYPSNTPSIRVVCYCGKSSAGYQLSDLRSQRLEFLAVQKAVADCPDCSTRHPMSVVRSEATNDSN